MSRTPLLTPVILGRTKPRTFRTSRMWRGTKGHRWCCLIEVTLVSKKALASIIMKTGVMQVLAKLIHLWYHLVRSGRSLILKGLILMIKVAYHRRTWTHPGVHRINRDTTWWQWDKSLGTLTIHRPPLARTIIVRTWASTRICNKSTQ